MFLPRTFRPMIRHFNTKTTPTFGNAIAEFNKEMEQLFGTHPSDTDFSSITNNIVTSQEHHFNPAEDVQGLTQIDNISISQEPHFAPIENIQGLTHINPTTGKAQMVDVSSTPTFGNTIAEFNKEMEQLFGEPPSDIDFSSTTNNTAISQEPHFGPAENVQGLTQINNISTSQEPHFAPIENIQGLTHINTTTGKAQMVDVSSKNTTKRVAIAGCKVILGKTVFDLVSANQIAKGDVLSVAKIAGITGAKQTSNLIPLCHNINLTHVNLDLTLDERNYSVEIQGKVSSTGMTGVEMEAMTAVTIAGLTVYDMCKAASKDIQITDVRLEHKSGGKSGDWSRKI